MDELFETQVPPANETLNERIEALAEGIYLAWSEAMAKKSTEHWHVVQWPQLLDMYKEVWREVAVSTINTIIGFRQ